MRDRGHGEAAWGRKKKGAHSDHFWSRGDLSRRETQTRRVSEPPSSSASRYLAPRTCISAHGKVCVFHQGDELACPRGPYTERSVF